MSEYDTVGPFDTVESAEAFLSLLNDSVADALRDVEVDLQLAVAHHQNRRVEALNLVVYNLNRLTFHVCKSRRLLNDLRMLRRLLLREPEHLSQRRAVAGVG